MTLQSRHFFSSVSWHHQLDWFVKFRFVCWLKPRYRFKQRSMQIIQNWSMLLLLLLLFNVTKIHQNKFLFIHYNLGCPLRLRTAVGIYWSKLTTTVVCSFKICNMLIRIFIIFQFCLLFNLCDAKIKNMPKNSFFFK